MTFSGFMLASLQCDIQYSEQFEPIGLADNKQFIQYRLYYVSVNVKADGVKQIKEETWINKF